jgi:acyl-coenzyme A thioesterase PaaI-like protein
MSEPSLPLDPRRVYVTEDPEEGDRRSLKHKVVAETKRVVEAVALLDLSATSLIELEGLLDAARSLAHKVESMQSLASVGGLASAGLEDAALMERSGISGRSNPLAPPLHLEMGGDVVRGHAVWTAAYEGPPGCLHGGFVAAAFDDLMGFAQMLSGSAGYTGTLTVRMRRPTPLDRRIDYEAGLDRVNGRKIICWGRSYDGDALLAEAEILFVAPRDDHLARTGRSRS